MRKAYRCMRQTMKILYAEGMRVYAPTCPKCGSDDEVIVQDHEDSWTYHCLRCKRDIEYEELMKQERY